MTRYPRGKLSNMLPPLIWIVHFNKSKECHWQRLQNHIVFKTLELLAWSIFLKLICCVEFFSVIILLSRARILKTRKMISQKRCAAYSRQSPHLHSLSVKILYRGVMDRALYTEMCSKHWTGFLQVQWRLYRFVFLFVCFAKIISWSLIPQKSRL